MLMVLACHCVLVGQDAVPTVIPHKIKLGPFLSLHPHQPVATQAAEVLVVTCHQVETAHINRNLPLRKQYTSSYPLCPISKRPGDLAATKGSGGSSHGGSRPLFPKRPSERRFSPRRGLDTWAPHVASWVAFVGARQGNVRHVMRAVALLRSLHLCKGWNSWAEAAGKRRKERVPRGSCPRNRGWHPPQSCGVAPGRRRQ